MQMYSVDLNLCVDINQHLDRVSFLLRL